LFAVRAARKTPPPASAILGFRTGRVNSRAAMASVRNDFAAESRYLMRQPPEPAGNRRAQD
jgi:hypothetical protein